MKSKPVTASITQWQYEADSPRWFYSALHMQCGVLFKNSFVYNSIGVKELKRSPDTTVFQSGPPAQTHLPGAALSQTPCHLSYWRQWLSDSRSSRATGWGGCGLFSTVSCLHTDAWLSSCWWHLPGHSLLTSTEGYFFSVNYRQACVH